jgi:hypothetical protein
MLQYVTDIVHVLVTLLTVLFHGKGILTVFGYKKKQWKPPIKKGKIMRKNPRMPNAEEQGSMPQHRHCPLGKHREDKTQSTMKSSIKTLQDFSPRISPKTVEREHK